MADGGFHNNQELMDNERYDEELASDFSDSDDKQVRLCTECPANLNATTTRFEAPILLAGKGIPCLIFGEDALALVFWVPTGVSALHVVVANENRDSAVDIITSSLAYGRSGPEPGPGSIDPALPLLEQSDFTNSVYLKAKADISKSAGFQYGHTSDTIHQKSSKDIQDGGEIVYLLIRAYIGLRAILEIHNDCSISQDSIRIVRTHNVMQ